jgi:two-component system, OmpR family, sensor histidine kinase MprB
VKPAVRSVRPARWLRRLGLRWQLGLAATAAVAAVLGLVAVLGYITVRNDLVSDVDRQLHGAYLLNQRFADRRPLGPPPGPLSSRPGATVQYVTADGTVTGPAGDRPPLPVDAHTRRVAQGLAGTYLSDVDSAGIHMRVLTGPVGRGAVQIALPMSDVDRTLARLEVRLLYAGLFGLVLAVLLNWLVGRTVLGPVSRLTRATEQISSTMDLGHRMSATGPDELRRLAVSFNAMLDAVGRSVDAQRQLVADASHELRTPLTSLRTNVELLARAQQMPAADRARLVARIEAGMDELAGLVNDTVDLARGEQVADPEEYLDLEPLVRDAVQRAASHWPAIGFQADLVPVLVHGTAARLARAVGNLLDNAAKFSSDGGSVEVSVRGSDGGAMVTVTDHGGGVAQDDLPRVFDRFYRSPDARRVPGAGLGLAIVGQVASGHGGWARLERVEGGGTRALLWLPTAEWPEAGVPS